MLYLPISISVQLDRKLLQGGAEIKECLSGKLGAAESAAVPGKYDGYFSQTVSNSSSVPG
jgi:hypothetical protein